MMKIDIQSTTMLIKGDTARVDLFYPRNPDSAKAVEIGLMDVRAADSIKVSYDFDRDGWSIKQASKFEWSSDDGECDSDWQEVAFVKAWARDTRP